MFVLSLHLRWVQRRVYRYTDIEDQSLSLSIFLSTVSCIMLIIRRVFPFAITLLFTLILLPSAYALKWAGAFETVGPIYRTYRVAVTVWGPKQEKIFPALVGKGTHKDGGANLLEVVNQVYGLELPLSTFGSLDLNDPPLKDAARVLNNAVDPSDNRAVVRLMQLPLIFERPDDDKKPGAKPLEPPAENPKPDTSVDGAFSKIIGRLGSILEKGMC